MLATIPLAFLSRIPGLATHPLHAGLVDLFFALFWLAIMAELAAYSDVAAPKDVTIQVGSTICRLEEQRTQPTVMPLVDSGEHGHVEPQLQHLPESSCEYQHTTKIL